MWLSATCGGCVAGMHRNAVLPKCHEPSRAHQEMTASFRNSKRWRNFLLPKRSPVEIVPWQPPPPPVPEAHRTPSPGAVGRAERRVSVRGNVGYCIAPLDWHVQVVRGPVPLLSVSHSQTQRQHPNRCPPEPRPQQMHTPRWESPPPPGARRPQAVAGFGGGGSAVSERCMSRARAGGGRENGWSSEAALATSPRPGLGTPNHSTGGSGRARDARAHAPRTSAQGSKRRRRRASGARIRRTEPG